MTAADLLRLAGLAACWGLAFVFIRVAVPALGVFPLVEMRALIACVILLACAKLSGITLDLGRYWRHYLAMGAIGSAAPFTMIALAQTAQSASYGVILTSTAPMFSALVAALWIGEPFTLRKGAGLTLGLTGVVLLVGWNPASTSVPPLWAIALTLGASAFYGISGVYAKRNAADIAPIAAAAGSQAGAALLLMPMALASLPAAPPEALVWINVIALGVFSSALAFILYFSLVASIGPVKTVSVNYLTPLFGVGGGVVLLDESVTFNMLAGAAVIFGGMALVFGGAGDKAGARGNAE